MMLRALSIIFGAVPFLFALIRAVRTGHDVRYFWVAIGSLVGALATMAIGRANIRQRGAAVALSAGVFVMATVLAVLAAMLIGTKFGLGIVTVAAGFGVCLAVAGWLHTRARGQAR
jgi:hypothetical protein